MKLNVLAVVMVMAIPTAGVAQTTAPAAPMAPVNLGFDPLGNPTPIDPFKAGVIIDFREEMRKFVRSISSYIHGLSPSFIVIAKDGLGLMNKVAPNDETSFFPAQAYIQSIDGLLETNLLDETVTTPLGKPSLALEKLLRLKHKNLATAATYGLTVLNMEYSTAQNAVDTLYTESAQKGFIPFVAEGPQLKTIPKNPAAIFKANPRNINAISELKNYLFISNSKLLGATPDYLLKLRNTNYDALIIDVLHGSKPLTRAQVEVLKYKRLGSRRLVLAQVDISSASMFRYYWAKGWRKGNPPFIFSPLRENPDSYRTTYWAPGWQSIISGNPNSYIYGLGALGFDGVVLKGVDAWTFYEAGPEAQ
ncbi:MAG: hypothetical protein JKY17_05260 [Magnetovibrio sp.]|nr:hypothetical protein [Magnetovibrio sp.]